MTKKSVILVWSAIGAVVLAGIIWAIVWAARPVSTVDGYPLDAIGTNDWVEGAKTPGVVLVEYSDFECPYCADFSAVVKQLPDLYPDTLAVVFRNYPLSGHANAMPAAKAAEAAGKQGKFFEMHDLLFENQKAWSGKGDGTPTFEGYARELGLNLDQYRTDVASQAVQDGIALQMKSGDAAKISGTPTFFLNGTKIQPKIELKAFTTLIDEALKTAQVATDTDQSSVHIHANVRIVVDGQPLDLSQDRYTKPSTGVEPVHFHDDTTDVHRAGVSINDLLSTFGMNLDRDCLTLDAGTTKCATGANKVRLYVNGQQNTDYGDYVMEDLDRILIMYGPDTDVAIQAQIKAVPDTACIYSRTCPERGSPPAVECPGVNATECY